MPNHDAFTYIDSDLDSIFEEIREREPIFHTREFGNTVVDFDSVMAPEYWEVGASGRRYSRDFILHYLAESPPLDAAAAGWRSEGYGLRRLGPDTYLFTYTLHQGQRVTRRATIWQSAPEGWRILYHQGTIVSGEEDDVAPS
ncbi:MAG TPA: hypothetical protein VFA65_08805 [Bryobacteraceae bacterium]|nr:hypothetical protein [Bryobacteraceae bacterium]